MATAAVTNTFADATPIEAADFNQNFSDLVSFLNASVIQVDGSVAATGDIPLGGNKITGLGTPVADTDAATKLYVDGLVGGGSHNHAGEDITSGTVAAARIADLDAAKITTGAFASARIPSLDASKITTGTLNTSRIPWTDTPTISPTSHNLYNLGSSIRAWARLYAASLYDEGGVAVLDLSGPTFIPEVTFNGGINVPTGQPVHIRGSGTSDMFWDGIRRINDSAWGSVRLEGDNSYRAYFHTSTKYVKDNILDIPVEDSKRVMEVLRPSTYNSNGKRNIGFIAENVQEAEPLTAPPPRETERGPDEVPTYSEDGILAHLVNLVADHERRIAELEARLDGATSGS